MGATAALSAVLYFLPVIIAGVAPRPSLAAVAVINILAGWTVAGWVIALVVALRSTRLAASPARVTQILTAPLPRRPGRRR